MKIDIRNESRDEVEEIQFADDEAFVGSRLVYEECGVKIIDCDGDEEGSIEFKDIDNLILALQKAKELWS